MNQSSIPKPYWLRGLPHHSFLLIALTMTACAQETQMDPLIRLTGSTMGTGYTVKFRERATELDRDRIYAEIDEILARINSRMSTYQADSELSLFNKAQTTDWITVSAETAMVIDEALGISRLTDGAFDITVEPLVDLWGFGPSPRTNTLPSDGEIREALNVVGYARIRVRESPPAIRKDHPSLQIDLSAIAKGYAVDQVAEYLQSRQVSDYLVEIGGELRAKGEKVGGIPWKIAVERPVPEERAIFRVLHLADQSMATSGDYRNFFEKDGTLFSHTINPRTGKPVNHNLASVTVLGASCMRADALATGLMVLGPEAGYELATQENLPALFVTRTADGFEVKATPELERFLVS